MDKKQKATINLKTNDGRCFQYALTVALKKILKEYQILNHLLINTIGKI